MSAAARPPGGPPALDLAAYRARLSDAAFWAPYVAAVLRRHGLPTAPPRAGTPGTFPTFLTGAYVIKFFGPHFGGAADHATERAAYEVLGDAGRGGAPALPVPALAGAGHLVEEPARSDAPGGSIDDGSAAAWPWPYLITTRVDGAPWRAAALSGAAQRVVARQLGAVLRVVHALPHPPRLVEARGPLLAELRATCAARQRAWGTLPAHLVAQIPAYVADYRPPPPAQCRLVHADLHADHLFAADGPHGARLVGVIDWADALVCDPYYELPALHLGTFGGDCALLGAFLDGYGWAAGPDFARRAMTMALLHQFDVWESLAHTGLGRAATLEELAARIWHV